MSINSWIPTLDGLFSQCPFIGRHLWVVHAAKLLQSCLTLYDPIDGCPPGSPIPGILQARTLEWVAISFSNVWKWKVKGKSFSYVRLLVTPWTAAYQALPSMGFSSRVPLPSPMRGPWPGTITDLGLGIDLEPTESSLHIGPMPSFL